MTSRVPMYFTIPFDAAERECRSCGAPIYWIETKTGKRMPVEVDSDDPQQMPPRDGIDGTGVSHFATCPHAGAWRK